MSILNITPANFKTGMLCINTTIHTEADLQIYIDQFEKDYLIDLLGCELYDLFAADLVSGVPQSAIYLSIYNSFCEDESSCGIKWVSEGMVKMLEKFIFWEYTRDQKVKNTFSGNVVNENEASRETSFPESRIFQIYNQAIVSYKAIQWFICDNSSDYPTYNGCKKGKTNWL